MQAQRGSELILLADSTKLGKNGFGKICDMARVDVLITDDGLPQSVRSRFEEKGVKVVIFLFQMKGNSFEIKNK